MKPKTLLFLLATLFVSHSARSAPFTWDITAGTVTINTASGVTANQLTFNSTGYIVSGNVPATDVLTLAGSTPTIKVTSTGHSATISANIAGSDGLTKSGAGALALTGTISTVDSTSITEGALRVGSALSLNSNLVLNGGVFSPGTSFTRTLGTAGNQVKFTGSGGFWAFGEDKTARFGSSTSTVMTWASTANFLGDGHSFILSHETATPEAA